MTSRDDKNCERLVEELWACVPGVFNDSMEVKVPVRLIHRVRGALRASTTELPSNGCIALTYGKLKAALKELLRLYDWRNEIGTIERDFNHDKKQVKTWLNQYGREKKQAWHVARETLSGAPDIDSLMLHERIQREAQMRTKSSTAAAHPGASASVCPTCGGNGNHRLARTEPLPCETCAGIGYVALSASGTAEQDRRVKVIESFRSLKEDWDSYGAGVFTHETIELALRVNKTLGDDWKLVPCADGPCVWFYRGDEEEIITVRGEPASLSPNDIQGQG